MLILIDISSKKDLTVGAYAFCTSLRAHRLLMLSPMSFSYQTLIFVLGSWASLNLCSNLRGSVKVSGLDLEEDYEKFAINIFPFLSLCIILSIPLLYRLYLLENNKNRYCDFSLGTWIST